MSVINRIGCSYVKVSVLMKFEFLKCLLYVGVFVFEKDKSLELFFELNQVSEILLVFGNLFVFVYLKMFWKLGDYLYLYCRSNLLMEMSIRI